MTRARISFTAAERRLLHAEAERSGRSISALIRDAVNHMYGPSRNTDTDMSAIAAAFGAWSERVDDGETTVDQLRSGARLERSTTR